MKRKTWLYLIVPALVMVAASVAAPSEAQAQYYGGGGYRGGGPPPGGGMGRPRWGFRHRTHFYAGGQLQGFVVAAQVTDTASGEFLGHGGGGGLFAGVRLNPFFSIELNWGITYHDTAYDVDRFGSVSIYLMTITADAKIHIPTRGPIEPYFQAGLGFGYTGLSFDNGFGGGGSTSANASGPAFNLGGGIDVWMSPFFSIGGRLLYRGIYFREVGAGNNTEANFTNGVSVDVNVTFHF